MHKQNKHTADVHIYVPCSLRTVQGRIYTMPARVDIDIIIYATKYATEMTWPEATEQKQQL